MVKTIEIKTNKKEKELKCPCTTLMRTSGHCAESKLTINPKISQKRKHPLGSEAVLVGFVSLWCFSTFSH